MIQKFFRGQRVRIAPKLPEHARHFEADAEAIIDHSYADAHGPHSKDSFNEYALIILEPNSIGNTFFSAWYSGNLLTLVSDDRHHGERLIQAYNESRL